MLNHDQIHLTGLFARQIPALLRSDIRDSVRTVLLQNGLINIPVLAEQIRLRNEAQNVAREDIEYELLQQAQRLHAPIIFDGTPMEETTSMASPASIIALAVATAD